MNLSTAKLYAFFKLKKEVFIPLLKTTIMASKEQKDLRSDSLNTCLNLRLIKLRSTAEPLFFETESPKREKGLFSAGKK